MCFVDKLQTAVVMRIAVPDNGTIFVEAPASSLLQVDASLC